MQQSTALSGRMTAPHLRAERLRAGYSQAALAQRSGVAAMTIRRIEHGAPAIGATLLALARALDVEPSALVTGQSSSRMAPWPRELAAYQRYTADELVAALAMVITSGRAKRASRQAVDMMIDNAVRQAREAASPPWRMGSSQQVSHDR